MKTLVTICTSVALIFTASNPAYAAILNVPSPYSTIQAGIDAAVDGDEVVVADGIYTGTGNRDIDFKGKAITVRSKNGPENCIIDCQGTESDPHRGFHFHNGETTASVLDGFTITNGYGQHFVFEYTGWVGGGIFCNEANPTIMNCRITNNTGDFAGGILLVNSNEAEFIDCDISGNSSLEAAGGVLCFYSDAVLDNCVISNNSTVNSSGGGIMLEVSDARISNSYISDNYAGAGGGGIHMEHFCEPTIVNCVIARNSADRWGGGVICYNLSHAEIINCTITDNSAGHGGSGVAYNNSSPRITNCILWNKPSDEVARQGGSRIPVVTYSDVQSGTGQPWFGVGCIDTDPLFADPDRRLSPCSPCIDVGNNSAVAGIVTDLDGNPRIINGIVDMGAYEAAIIESIIDIEPDTLNLNSNDKWITCYIEFPVSCDVVDIDGSTVMLDGIPAYIGKEGWARAGANTSNIMDHDEDGISERMVKFDASAVKDIVDLGTILLTINGELVNGMIFEGTDIIRVIDQGKKK